MKYIITLHQINQMKTLAPYVDGFIIGNDAFGTRLTHSFSIDEINEMITLCHQLHKELFLVANQMMTDDMIEKFQVWLDQFDFSYITGIVVADLGALVALREKGLHEKGIYNPETLITNHYDFNFLDEFSLFGVYAAKEITLDDLKAIGKKKLLKMFMVGHGHLNMFYSKRQLIRNYLDYLKEEHDLHLKQNLLLIEEKRAEEPYPILEDDAGTHVFRSRVMHGLSQMETLATFLDYFVIDTLFKDDTYGLWVAQMYHDHDLQLMDKIQKTYHETWDEGFFFKKTIYMNKGKDND